MSAVAACGRIPSRSILLEMNQAYADFESAAARVR
jgi:hypothetical protein